MRAPAGRRGQAAVLIALCLFSLVIFMALATNMGILVNDKVRMQNAADLAAYAAAYKEAQKLNGLVEKNEAILDKVKECRDNLTRQPWPNQCDCEARSLLAETYLNICQLEIEMLATEFVWAASWGNTVSPAMTAGMNTMDANVPGLRSSGSSMHQGLRTSSRFGAYTSDPTLFVPFNTPAIANYRRVQDTKFNYPVLLLCDTPLGCIPTGVVPSATTHELATWYYKDDTQPDIWVMAEASGTPRASYLDIAYGGSSDGGYFGGSSLGGSDRMTAIAVAKPYGGSIGPTAASPAQRSANTDPAGPYWVGRGTRFAKLTMQDEYRARLAGIPEWDRGGVNADNEPRTGLMANAWGSSAHLFRH